MATKIMIDFQGLYKYQAGLRNAKEIPEELLEEVQKAYASAWWEGLKEKHIADVPGGIGSCYLVKKDASTLTGGARTLVENTNKDFYIKIQYQSNPCESLNEEVCGNRLYTISRYAENLVVFGGVKYGPDSVRSHFSEKTLA